jgi:hypothetical protein
MLQVATVRMSGSKKAPALSQAGASLQESSPKGAARRRPRFPAKTGA